MQFSNLSSDWRWHPKDQEYSSSALLWIFSFWNSNNSKKTKNIVFCTFRGLDCLLLRHLDELPFFAVVFRVYKFSNLTLICRQILSCILEKLVWTHIFWRRFPKIQHLTSKRPRILYLSALLFPFWNQTSKRPRILYLSAASWWHLLFHFFLYHSTIVFRCAIAPIFFRCFIAFSKNIVLVRSKYHFSSHDF